MAMIIFLIASRQLAHLLYHLKYQIHS